jgi:glycosyltransferase involved in cell wall biosynthesis
MKLLFVNTLYAPHAVGGAERSTQWLAEACAQQGHEVSVATLDRATEVSGEVLNEVRVHRLPLANFFWPWDGRRHRASPFWHVRDIDNTVMERRFGQVLDTVAPDLVHTNALAGFSVSAWRACAVRDVPIIHTQRDYYLLCPNSSMYRRGENCDGPCTRCAIFNARKRELSRLVGGVIGISRHMLEVHQRHAFFPHALFQRVIPNAYRAAHPVAEQTSRPSNLPLRLGFLGRQTPEKGLEVLLAASARQTAGRVEVLIAGSGREEYMADLRKRYPAARFLGYQQPADFFAQIDVLVIPSLWHEPLGRVVVEANAHGIPVIASQRGGLPELVEEGVNGFLFDPDSPDQLDATLERFLSSVRLASDMRAACLEKAEEFQPSRIATRYLASYEELIAQPMPVAA